jgi:hypothetical protein
MLPAVYAPKVKERGEIEGPAGSNEVCQLAKESLDGGEDQILNYLAGDPWVQTAHQAS